MAQCISTCKSVCVMQKLLFRENVGCLLGHVATRQVKHFHVARNGLSVSAICVCTSAAALRTGAATRQRGPKPAQTRFGTAFPTLSNTLSRDLERPLIHLSQDDLNSRPRVDVSKPKTLSRGARKLGRVASKVASGRLASDEHSANPSSGC